MTWGECAEWVAAAVPFLVMSGIPVVANLAVTGWDLSEVSWVAWALSAWLFFISIMGIRGAIADNDPLAHTQSRQDHTRT